MHDPGGFLANLRQQFATPFPHEFRQIEVHIFNNLFDALDVHSGSQLGPFQNGESAERGGTILDEFEIGVLKRRYLNRCIDNHLHLVAEITAWQNQRNDHAARVKWMATARWPTPVPFAPQNDGRVSSNRFEFG